MQNRNLNLGTFRHCTCFFAFQTGESAEIKSIQSTSSSERIHGYLGDSESSASLSSLHVSVADCRTENTFEEQRKTPESKCREETNICQTTGKIQ